MWLYTDKGSVSVVEDKDDTNYLWVRSRTAEVLLNWSYENPIELENCDYRYRIRVNRFAFLRGLMMIISSLHYHNFKEHVGTVNPELLPVYHGVYHETTFLTD